MIFNMTAPGGGGSVAGWTDVSYTEIGTFYGYVLTDGHLCVITADHAQVVENDDGYIIGGLPLPQVPINFTASRGQSYVVPLLVDTNGDLMLTSLDFLNPDVPFDGFTIIYPIAS